MIQETTVNIIAEGTRIEGKVVFDQIARVHGVLSGEVTAKDGSTLILAETCLVEGDIHGDTVMIDGYVKGDVFAKTRVVVSSTGRVVGNIRTRSLRLEFGAHFEGKSIMESDPKGAATAGPQLSPA